MSRITIEVIQQDDGNIRTTVSGVAPVPGSAFERYTTALIDAVLRAAAAMRNRPVIEGTSRRVQ